MAGESIAVRDLSEPVHWCVHSSNGHDMRYACGEETEWPSEGPIPRVYKSANGLYTFDKGKVTCPKCLNQTEPSDA